MTDDEKFADFATVRDLLIDAQERRGFLTYEQKIALQHAEWASSDNRNGYKTDSKVFNKMFDALMKIEKFSKYPEVAAKMAELMPRYPDDVRVVLASRRIAIEAEEIEQILDIIKQNIGFE